MDDSTEKMSDEGAARTRSQDVLETSEQQGPYSEVVHSMSSTAISKEEEIKADTTASSSEENVRSASSIVKSKEDTDEDTDQVKLSSSEESVRSASSIVKSKDTYQDKISSSEESVRSDSSIVKSKEVMKKDDLPEESHSTSSIAKLKEAIVVPKDEETELRRDLDELIEASDASLYGRKSLGKRLCLHDLYVHTFHPKFPELVVILSEDCLAGDIKHKIGETLELQVDSLYLFGLFEHKLGYPTKYISDDTPVKNCKTVSFQRFSFDPQLEIDITRHDDVCMEMIYHEIIHKLQNNMLFPSVPDLQSQISKDHSTKTLSLMSVFLQRIRQRKLSYWCFYYRADNCMLGSKFLVSDPRILKKDYLNAAFDFHYLILIHEGRGTVNFYSWSQIYSVRMHCQKKLVKICLVRESKLYYITLYNEDFHEYIFTVSVYLIKLHEAMVDRRSPFRSSPDVIGNYLVFYNDAFQYQGILQPMLTRQEHKSRVTGQESQETSQKQSASGHSGDHKGSKSEMAESIAATVKSSTGSTDNK